jgi:hypothetical protein
MGVLELVKAGWLSPIHNTSALVKLLWPFWFPLAALFCLMTFFSADIIQFLSDLPERLGTYGFISAVVVTVILGNAILATAFVNWHRFLILGETGKWSTIVPKKAGWKYLGFLWLLYLPAALFQELSTYFIQDLLPWSISSTRSADGSGIIYVDNSFYILRLIDKVIWLLSMLVGLSLTFRYWPKLPQIAVAGSVAIAGRKLFLALAISISMLALIDLLFLAWNWVQLPSRTINYAVNLFGFFARVWAVVAIAGVLSFAYKDARIQS